MKILAIDASAKACSVCVSTENELISQYYQKSGLTHSRTLLAMCDDMLKNLDMTAADVDGVAVTKGPGSFTGVRIGVAAAKGLCWGADKPLCGVSTLEAMAYNCRSEEYILCAVMDARRAQVYNALFEWNAGKLTRLCEDRAISLENLYNSAKVSEKPYFIVGDGTELCYNYFLENGLECIPAPENIRYQCAFGAAQAAFEGGVFEDAAILEPNYIRLSQAEREMLAKISNK